MLFSIKVTVDRIEGEKAVLIIDQNLKTKISPPEIIWPKAELPPAVVEGDSVILGILKADTLTNLKEELARSMLEALLSKKING